MQYRHVRIPRPEERQELERIMQQEVGRVSLRAHLVLLSSQGFTVPELVRIFALSEVSIYHWFNRFDEEGPAGLFDRPRSGRPPELDAETAAEIEHLIEEPPTEQGYNFTTWTVPLLRQHLIETSALELAEETIRASLHRRGFAWRRPRYYIDYQDPEFDQRMAQIEAAIAKADAETAVLFEDETTFKRLPPLRQMWMRRGRQVRIPVPEQNGQFALYGVLDVRTGQTYTAPFAKTNSEHTIAYLKQVLGRFKGQIVLIWDQAKYHTSEKVRRFLAGVKRLTVLLLPKRAPQENPIEDVWRAVKKQVAANLQRSLEALKAACSAFFEALSPKQALQLAGLADHP